MSTANDLRTARVKLLERDNYRCQECDKEVDRSSGVLHHLRYSNGLPQYDVLNNPENLITVCWGCHRAIHKQNSDLQRPQGRMWNTFDAVEQSVRLILGIYSRTNALPNDLVIAYRTSLEMTSPGVVDRFYQELMKLCPDAITYFSP
jgi:hypothetical protein